MTYRAIDTSDFEPMTASEQDRPKLEWVPINALIINEAYQRPIEKKGKTSIQKIAQNFHWGRFSPLLVSKMPDGKYAIIDGQHRAHAAAICGIETVPALVADLTEQEQAAAFSWVNGNVTALTALQVYRAALSAMEPWAVQCDAAVSRAGCRMMTSNKSSSLKKGGEVFCVSAIRRIVEAGHSQYLIAALSGLKASVNGEEAAWYGANELTAMVGACAELGITRKEVIEGFLADNDLWDVKTFVLKIQQRPEYREKSYRSLYADSLKVMIKSWMGKQVTAQ